jgi:hypothetical protein
MTDVESRQPIRNPYAALGEPPRGLPPRHPLNIFKRSTIVGACLFGLHKFKVYETVMYSPKVRHEWFKIGLAASVGEF